MIRMWIDQPSSFQPLHHLHGTNVLAVPYDEKTYVIYFLDGGTISQEAPSLSLSFGWKNVPGSAEFSRQARKYKKVTQ